MQHDLGTGGVMKFKPPHANYFINEYAVVLNMLPELHQSFRDEILRDRIAASYATTLDEVLSTCHAEVLVADEG